jgi:hypothetical protein
MAGNITIYDRESDGSASGWYGKQEDNEVELGNVTGQTWDLEGAFLNGKTLTLVGGWDFKNGVQDPYRAGTTFHYDSGDIFFDINGDAKYGDMLSQNSGTTGIQTINNSFGYDYVLDVDWSGNTFNIVQIKKDSLVQTTYFGENNRANPWQYASGGTVVGSGTWDYTQGLTNEQTGFEGDSHYSAAFDLTNFFSLFPGGTEFLMHFTMECGNDNLIAAVPEPATIIISLSTLFGSVGYLRRKKFF